MKSWFEAKAYFLSSALWCVLAFCPLYHPASAETLLPSIAYPDAPIGSPYEQRRAMLRLQKQEQLSTNTDSGTDTSLNIAMPQADSEPFRQLLKVTIPNLDAAGQVQRPSAIATAQDAAYGQRKPVNAPMPLTANDAPSQGFFERLLASLSLTSDESGGDSARKPFPPATLANNGNAAQPVSTHVYQSPEAIIKKEVVHLTPSAEMAQASPLIPNLTPAQLAALAPAAGGDAPGVNTPLIPTPPDDHPAIQQAAPTIIATPAFAEPTPAAAVPLSEVKPLLESLPAATPNDAAADTALQSLIAPATTPLPAIIPPDTVAPARKKSARKNVPDTQNPPASENTSEPSGSLAPESKALLTKIPANLDGKKKASEAIDVSHAKNTPDALGSGEATVKRGSMDIKIAVKTPKFDSNYQLEQAYNALAAGHTSEAIDMYNTILVNDPENKNALFGLATSYHRVGQLEKARPLYTKLLTIDPGNRDGLNNFLVLMADEAPEEALVQLEKLEERNPQFSPIPAQMAVIYQKLGNFDKASEKMFHAIELSPENLTYRYNLAIMLDKQKKYDEAAKLYHQIVEAYKRGDAIPGNIDKIQQRLTFISSNRQ